MKSGWFRKLNYTSCVVGESQLHMLAGTSSSIPSPVNQNFTFPTITSNILDFECSLFKGAKVRREKICTVTGTFTEEVGPVVVTVTGQTGLFNMIQKDDFIKATSGFGFGNLGWGRILDMTSSPQTLTVGTGSDLNNPGTISFDIYRRMGFENAGYSIISASSASSTKTSNYNLLSISTLAYTSGVATGVVTSIMVPCGTPFKVQLPDSLLADKNILFTYVSALLPSAQGGDSVAHLVLK